MKTILALVFSLVALCSAAINPMPGWMYPPVAGGGGGAGGCDADCRQAIHDSIVGFTNGTRDINVDEAIIRTADVTERFRAGDLGGGQYAIDLASADPFSLTINNAVILTANGGAYIGEVTPGGANTATITGAEFSVNESITPEFYGGLNVHQALSVGDAGSYYAFQVELGDPFTITFKAPTYMNDGANIGKDGMGNYAMQVGPSSVLIGNDGVPATTDAFGDVNVHQALNVDGAVTLSDLATGDTRVVCVGGGGNLFPGTINILTGECTPL